MTAGLGDRQKPLEFSLTLGWPERRRNALGLPSGTSKQTIASPRAVPVRHRRFYRSGLYISNLQTLFSCNPISISCNVALGEPTSLVLESCGLLVSAPALLGSRHGATVYAPRLSPFSRLSGPSVQAVTLPTLPQAVSPLRVLQEPVGLDDRHQDALYVFNDKQIVYSPASAAPYSPFQRA